jgi:SAM-dependent methyltransferase
VLSTERFQNRVDDYVRYRPSYPAEMMTKIIEHCGIDPSSVIADIGSGTGLLAQLFLNFGCTVFGVEPNAGMRAAAEDLLASSPRFQSVHGTAEATNLPAHSCDAVTCGQSFHWFDAARSREEFTRILKPSGWVVLVWNERQKASTPFLAGYERLLRQHSPEYQEIEASRSDSALFDRFFGANRWSAFSFVFCQRFDFEGALGRLRSSSYSPLPGTAEYVAMEQNLRNLVAETAINGDVTFLYDTRVYMGRLLAPSET